MSRRCSLGYDDEMNIDALSDMMMRQRVGILEGWK